MLCVLDFDRADCVGRRVAVLRHDHGHGFTDEAHYVQGHGRPLEARQPTGKVRMVDQIRSGPHTKHAGHPQRRPDIDRCDAGVRVR